MKTSIILMLTLLSSLVAEPLFAQEVKEIDLNHLKESHLIR